VILATALIFSLAGIWYARGKRFTLEDFISARGSSALWTTVATLVASSMGAWILFSPAEATIRNNVIALIGYALGSAAALFLFAFVGQRLRDLMPNGHSITEYVYHRFGTAMYLLVVIISVFYMSVFLTAELTGIALAAQLVFNIPLLYTAVIVGVGTLAYTSLGGIRASVFTDTLQSLLIIPLLLLLFLASLFLFNGFESLSESASVSPQMFNGNFLPGIEAAFAFLIAIVAANWFHQGYWQRVFLPRTKSNVFRAFTIAGLIVIPIVLITGTFGILSLSAGTAENASVALFAYFLQLPIWMVWLVMMLAVALVMSSMDTLLNGLVSLFTVDLMRWRPQSQQPRLLLFAKWLTVIISFMAIMVATQGHSVLYLFLVADLVCAAAFFPTVAGLFLSKYSGNAAFLASVTGMIAGSFFFPDAAFQGGNLLHAFLAALLVPIGVSLIFIPFNKPFDFKILKKLIVSLD